MLLLFLCTEVCMHRSKFTPDEYVDTREVWPIYVRGVIAITLPGKPRDISLEDARVVAGYTEPLAQ